jgi:K+-transporting ATPase ATPase C chain
MLRRQLVAGLTMTAVMIVLTGILYPLAVTAASQVLFPDRADGSFVHRDGQVVGSALIGQNFGRPEYFWPRPSAAGQAGYDALASGGSSLGPSNPKLLDAVAERIAAYRRVNGLEPGDAVPVDAVTASASGLDPHISVANARLQAARVASARGLSRDSVLQLVDAHTQARPWGFLGEDAVSVLELNLALDRLGKQ